MEHNVRDEYLSNGLVPFLPRTEEVNWLEKEAAADYDWEAAAKKELEVSAFARDFMRSFPAEAFGGVYKLAKDGEQKTLVKSADEVLADAYKWLDKKFKGDAKQARAVLDATGLVDEYVTGVMMYFNEHAAEEAGKETIKNRDEDDRQPAAVLEKQTESQTTAEAVVSDSLNARLDLPEKPTVGLERSKRVGSYGVIANETEVQLWKQGALVATLSTEDIGGFGVAADEIETLETPEDAEALFGVTAKTEEPALVGKSVMFTAGDKKLFGTVTALSEGTVSIRVEGMDDVECSVPVASVFVIQAAV